MTKTKSTMKVPQVETPAPPPAVAQRSDDEIELLGRSKEIARHYGLQVLGPREVPIESMNLDGWLAMPETRRYLGFIAEYTASARRSLEARVKDLNGRMDLPRGMSASGACEPLEHLCGGIVGDRIKERFGETLLMAAAEQRKR